jgi:hypothetical protein
MIESPMRTTIFAKKRLLVAMACYVILAFIGTVALDGILRGAVLCFFAILAVKTLIHSRKDEQIP